MTDITPALADVAHALHARIVARGKAVSLHLLALATDLAAMRDGRLYLALGHDSFDAYLAAAQLDISRNQVFKLLRVHDLLMLPSRDSTTPDTATVPQQDETGHRGTLIAVEDVMELGVDRVDRIRRALLDAPDAETRQEWLEKARTLSLSDLARELAEARGLDVDSAWRETAEYAGRRLVALGHRLLDAPTARAAATLLDEAVAVALKARGQLEERTVAS